MKEGDVILTALPQTDGKHKLRPALILRIMPGYNDLLLCGISTNISKCIKGFDETITIKDKDYHKSGLLQDSLIRLGFISVMPQKSIAGSIGKISEERYHKLMNNLINYLSEKVK
jgi:mRNA interferase MazF